MDAIINLVDQATHELEKINNMADMVGNRPHFPMFIASNLSSASVYAQLRRKMELAWPQSASKLVFSAYAADESGTVQLKNTSDNANIGEEQVQALLDEIKFSRETFESMSLYKHTEWVDGICFWIFIIMATALISAASVYVSYNAVSSFILISVSSIISILAIIILNVKNKNRFTGNKISKTIVVIGAFLWIIFPVRNFGVDYAVEVQNKVAQADVELGAQGVDTNDIYITVTPRGKDNFIKTCLYYWDDAENRDYARFDDNGTFRLSPRNGVLHVYAEDSYGVASTLTRRFCFRHLITPLSSGKMKSVESSSPDGYNTVQEAPDITESASDAFYE